MLISREVSVLLFCLLLPASAWSKVLLRWTQPTIASAKALGVTELVVSWNPDTPSLIDTARRQGYRVYVQATPEQIPEIAAGKSGLGDVIVEIPSSQLDHADEILQKLRSAYPKLTFLLLDPNGKQPQMKGTMVVKKNGVLEITSPTAQPWIDSNVPLVRLEQGFRPNQVPLYSFQWELADPLQKTQGPSAADYSLAIAEAGVLHADLILNLPDDLQKALAANEKTAWAVWNQVKPALSFVAEVNQKAVPEANIGVVTDNYDAAYEPMNLMARHNIAFHVLPVAKLNAKNFAGLKMLLVFASPNPQGIGEIANFAAAGGTAVLVGLKGFYPWHSAAATQTAQHAVSYSVGKGHVLELSEPVTDPETFAQDVRRLMGSRDVLLSLWNALTTIGIAYGSSAGGPSVVELVNYSGDPLRVQVRVQGSFREVRYESPERVCCQELTPVHKRGFTEFVVPSLKIAGRVHLAAPIRQ